MSRRGTTGLWIAAVLTLAGTVVLYFVDPGGGETPISRADSVELESTIARALTYYEFGHHNRAAETYALAAERGMREAAHWYRYAHSRDLAEGLDLDLYVRAYQLLLDESPNHEYLQAAEEVINEHTEEFDYSAARAGAYSEGTLLRIGGTVSRVIWGRVATGVDTLVVSTREDRWIGHSGDDIMVRAPRRNRPQAGTRVEILGRYHGLCTKEALPGASGDYPCVTAVTVRLQPPP